MTLIEIIRYAYEHPCSTLFVFLSIHEYEGMNCLLMNERFSTMSLPEFGDGFVVNGPKRSHRIMFIRDDSVVGVRLEEFNTIRPDDYLNFTGEK